MFCPQCKAEYREGFYRCTDCDVDLVSHLEKPAAEEQPLKGEPSVVLWRGQDPVVYTALLSALREAQIPSHQRAAMDYEILVCSTPGFEIRVFRSDLERAQTMLESVLKALKESADSPSLAESPPEAVLAERAGIPDNWDPEQAVAVAWSGDDAEMEDFLEDTLRENGIPCRTLAEPAPVRILVRPEDEARARRIVREVFEGRPRA